MAVAAASGAARTFGEGLRRSTVAHFASKVRGDEYCGGQTRLKIQRRYALKRWLYSLRVRGPHFASKVSYNAGAATDDCAGQRKSQLRRNRHVIWQKKSRRHLTFEFFCSIYS